MVLNCSALRGAARRPAFRQWAKVSSRNRLRVTTAAVQAPSMASCQQLQAWLAKRSVSTDKVGISANVADDKPMLTASKDMSAGEAVLTVPESSWISTQTVQRSAIGKCVADQEPWLQLALWLLHAKSTGSPDYAAFLANLPEQLDSPLFYTESQLALLKGTQVISSLYGYR